MVFKAQFKDFIITFKLINYTYIINNILQTTVTEKIISKIGNYRFYFIFKYLNSKTKKIIKKLK
jgi:hypothetical protein